MGPSQGQAAADSRPRGPGAGRDSRGAPPGARPRGRTAHVATRRDARRLGADARAQWVEVEVEVEVEDIDEDMSAPLTAIPVPADGALVETVAAEDAPAPLDPADELKRIDPAPVAAEEAPIAAVPEVEVIGGDSAHTLPPCPPEYEPSRTDYAPGSTIEMDGHSFVCLDDLGAYCNMPERDPSWSEAEEDLWIVAWDHVGACARDTSPPAEAGLTIEAMSGEIAVLVRPDEAEAGATATGSEISVEDITVEGITVEDITVEDITVEDITVEDITVEATDYYYEPTVSSIEATHALPDCPSPYDTAASYRANDEVEVDGRIFVCRGGDYEPYCSFAVKDAGWDEFEAALWNDAWQLVTPCSLPAAPMTEAPSPLIASDDDGLGLSGVIATLIPPSEIEMDVTTAAAAPAVSDFVASLPGSACIESYCSYELSDETTVKYQVVIPPGTSPEDGCDGCAVNVEVVHAVPGAWIGVGFSPDGRAGGSDAVVGVPAHGDVPASVARYSVRDDGSGIDPLPESEQTLGNAALTTVYGKTVVTFTKLLRDVAGTAISPVWNNIWLFSSGEYDDAEGSSAPGTGEWTAFDIALL